MPAIKDMSLSGNGLRQNESGFVWRKEGSVTGTPVAKLALGFIPRKPPNQKAGRTTEVTEGFGGAALSKSFGAGHKGRQAARAE
jgi:hypothetical protein